MQLLHDVGLCIQPPLRVASHPDHPVPCVAGMMHRLAAVAGAVALALALACTPVAALPRDLLQTSSAATTVIAESNTVRLTANITSLNSNAEIVNVTFTGVPNPNVNDAIAYIVPANATYSQTAPQKFK